MTDAPELNDDFIDLLVALQQQGVDFLVVGAHALAVHGVVRASGDLDVFVRADDDNARKVVAALHAFGAPLEAHGVSEADFARPGTVYQVGLPPRRIDIMTSLSGLDFDEALQGNSLVRMRTVEFRVPSASNLVVNKQASGRPKDLEDARRLLAIAGGTDPDADG